MGNCFYCQYLSDFYLYDIFKMFTPLEFIFIFAYLEFSGLFGIKGLRLFLGKESFNYL